MNETLEKLKEIIQSAIDKKDETGLDETKPSTILKAVIAIIERMEEENNEQINENN